MMVANIFDLWQKDAFFSAAEEVQESADVMESAYRTWVRERREMLSPEDSDKLCTELQTALGTSKWQLEEFERAVRLSYGLRGDDNTTARHRQFIAVIQDQISRVEASLKEYFNEEGKTFQWVNLDENERDELATFLSGTSQSLQSAIDECLQHKHSMESSLLENHAQRKDADLNLNASCNRGFSDRGKGSRDVRSISKDGNHVTKIEANQIHGRTDDIIFQADRTTNNARRTWSLPNFGELKIIIPDEEEPMNKLMPSIEDTPKVKGSRSVFWKQSGRKFPPGPGAVNFFSQLFGWVGGFQRQLQSPLYLSLRSSVQVTLVLMLTIFFIGIEAVNKAREV
ncbi:uncharacterized protein LOC121263024 [Juglans microcarpa x Juglans regia]|uniref:uncharacterized protein LOC121263024 n=1 Tax=Juglans microcarpa x Juglans regia TaxID=2249226 RepID=UPI001B7DEC9C|nr:uncharacterized protein LOC121263024 [Juglans microcarpa x Juglans regia]XP_041021726.1 uncharacterized protein LOC121263024 [Juglans microcarpa x Juglans regia]